MDYHQKFYQSHRFCPSCKQELERAGNRANCSSCGFEEYNNPIAAVSLTMIKDQQFLLAKRAVEPAKGSWDVLGGFIEVGESAEEAAVREMKEETGLDTTVKKYLGSTWDTYDDRPTLNLMYVMKLISDQEPKPADDVAELKWFPFANPPSEVAFRNVSLTIKKAQQYIGKGNP